MKINWKARFKNKAWLLTFISAVVAFGYTVLGMFDVVPPVSQDNVMQAVSIALTLLAGLGVIIDPTTAGVSDGKKEDSPNE
ncbi:MAG: phage holin [Bacillota bacterium]|nr:phage holin [Bacillota bacterium]